MSVASHDSSQSASQPSSLIIEPITVTRAGSRWSATAGAVSPERRGEREDGGGEAAGQGQAQGSRHRVLPRWGV